MKSFDLVKSNYEFRNDDVSFEFSEYVDYVFFTNKKIFIVFKKDFKNNNPKSHIKDYYKSIGFKRKNVIFLNQ